MSSYRRPKHHTYDYNFKVGESSYRDMLDYLDKKEGRCATSPPPAKKSFAERFAERPIYGEPAPLKLYQSEPPAAQRRTTERPSTDRWTSDRASSDRWASDRTPTDRWTTSAAERAGTSPRPERRPRVTLLDESVSERTSRAAPDEAALEMDPEELIASIRRGRAKRLELLSSLEADAADEEEAEQGSRRRRPLKLSSEEPGEEATAGRLRQLRLTGDQETGAGRKIASSSSYSARRSVSSKTQSSASATRSVHYE